SAEGVSSRHILAVLHGQYLRAHEARDLEPSRQADDGDEDAEGNGTPEGQHGDEEQHARYREEGVEEAHEYRVDAATDVAGSDTVRGPDGRREQHSEGGHGERDARPVENAAQHVAAEAIRAERMC